LPWLRTGAACSNASCASCLTAAACASAQGCVDRSAKKYDPQDCVHCEDCAVVHSPDPPKAQEDLGARAKPREASSCRVGVPLGAVGGMFVFVISCCVQRRNAQRRHLQWMLSADDSLVKRVRAAVKQSWIVASGAEVGQPMYMLKIEFEAARKDDKWVTIVADVPVLQESFSRARQVGSLEVAYAVGDELCFEVVANLEASERSRHGDFVVTCIVIAVCGAVGLAIGAASGPLTGCYLGYVPFFSLLVGSFFGHCVCWHFAHKFKRTWISIDVQPCSAPADAGPAALA